LHDAFAENRLTKVNVVALDRQGQFVAGLRSADFQIQENGKARKIVFFRFTGDTSAQPGGGGAYSNRSIAGRKNLIWVTLVGLFHPRLHAGLSRRLRLLACAALKRDSLSNELLTYLPSERKC
jgi:hypothetical protein